MLGGRTRRKVHVYQRKVSMSDPAKTNPMARVAVVAIHGVADQQPGATARCIADLLLMHEREAYSGFVERGVRIGVQAVRPELPGDDAEDERKKSFSARLAEEFRCLTRSKTLVAARNEAIKRTQEGQLIAPLEDIQHQYMCEQLEEFRPQGKDAVYETIRLSGEVKPRSDTEAKLPPQKQKHPEVHIFEMYWADLSRAAGAVYRLFVQLYLLLFVLCRLGRYSIQFARTQFTEPRQVKWWGRFESSQKTAEGLLVLAFPILGLCLLGLVVPMLPKHIQASYHWLAFNIATSVLALAIMGWLLYWRREPWWRKSWPRSYLALLGGGAVLWCVFYFPFRSWNPLVLLTVMGWLIAACVILWIMRLYQRQKPGALLSALIAVAVITGFLLPRLFKVRNGDEHDILDATLPVFEGTFAALGAFWVLFALAYWAVCFSGFKAVRTVTGAGSDVARRVRWTTHLTLLLPGAITALTTIVIGQALLTLFWRLIPHENHYYAPFVLAAWIHPTELVNFTRKMLLLTAGPYFTYGYALMLLAAAGLAWSLLPVFQAERHNPKDKEKDALGLCLDSVYSFARWPGIILGIAVGLTPILAFFTLIDPRYEWVWPDWLRDKPGRVLAPVGSALLLVAVGSKWPFKGLNRALRGSIDIALDVTNWLRLNPKKTNPKARISARFVSLLRHLHNWHDPEDGSRYAGIVIVAHSQGTVIAAEVLRFIAREASGPLHDPRLNGFGVDVPIYLLTMGSPLRQLYSLRLPHHYGWARHNRETNDDRIPDPQKLQVIEWVNLYRSADYVGRYLWHNDAEDDVELERFRTTMRQRGTHRFERCIGAGGHNHYWDETAERVAKCLHDLITRAAAAPGARGRGVGVADVETAKVGI